MPRLCWPGLRTGLLRRTSSPAEPQPIRAHPCLEALWRRRTSATGRRAGPAPVQSTDTRPSLREFSKRLVVLRERPSGGLDEPLRDFAAFDVAHTGAHDDGAGLRVH